MYRIILADGDVLTRKGVKKIIGNVAELEVIGEAESKFELMDLLKRLSADMIILNPYLLLWDTDDTREIKIENPYIKVLVLSRNKTKEFFYSMMAAGVDGYLLFKDTKKDLLDAIEKIRQGNTYISTRVPFILGSMATMIDKFGYVPPAKPPILRSIEFPPEHYEAGLTILSYFGKIVRQKYLGMKIRVNIEQEGLKVRMIVETDDGDIKKIEKTLEEYGMVIKGEMPMTDFISDPYQVAELKHQLRIADLQLESQKELLAISKNMHEQRIFNLEQQIKYLHSHIANGLKLLENRDIILSSAIGLIENKLNKEINENDVLEIKEALKVIQERDQSLFSAIINKINVSIIQGTISGVAVKLLCDFITKYLPKMG